MLAVVTSAVALISPYDREGRLADDRLFAWIRAWIVNVVYPSLVRLAVNLQLPHKKNSAALPSSNAAEGRTNN